jgi:hypothetical protein
VIGIIAGDLDDVRSVIVHREQLFLTRDQRDKDELFAVRRRKRIEILSVGYLDRNRNSLIDGGSGM